MRCPVPLIAAALSLAACSREPAADLENASVEEVAREVGDSGSGDMRFQPGKWESTVQLVSMEAPRMPEQVRSMMQGMNDQRQLFATCLTAEDAKRPGEDFFSGSQQGNCRYQHFRMAEGKIDAVMRCEGDSGAQVMRLTGEYSPQSYSMQMVMKAEGGPETMKDMTMNMRVDARRVGECDGRGAN